ncbi:MAG: peroxiredoxin family protein [Methylophilaceae bacterium]
MKRILLPLILFLLLGGLWLTLSSPDKAPQATFSAIDGQKITLDSLQGRVVLVNFWATSCPGCVKEMPQIVQAYQQHKAQGFEVIAVAMPYDPPENVMNYAKKNGLPFTVALDVDSALVKAFGDIQVTPSTVLIDKHGKIVWRVIGEIDFKALHEILPQLLKAS